MNIITKRADQLQPGDIIKHRNGDRRVVLRVMPATALGWVSFVAEPIGNTADQHLAEDCYIVKTLFDVEALTPAQQHADELLAALRDALAYIEKGSQPGIQTPPWVVPARTLLDRIFPPKAPTLEELAQALDVVMAGPGMMSQSTWREHLETIRKGILARARATGLVA